MIIKFSILVIKLKKFTVCVLLVALQQHERYPFILAANRDEFFNRPAAAANFWHDNPEILAGRDKTAGGTWLGITRSGRFAALTNHPGAYTNAPSPKSRGDLVREFLAGNHSIKQYLAKLDQHSELYDGYGIFFGTTKRLQYQTNQICTDRKITNGIYGLGNAVIDTPWLRVEEGINRFSELIENEQNLRAEDVFDVLCDSDSSKPHAKQAELALTAPDQLPIFVDLPNYGTRCSTVILVDAHGIVTFEERSFLPNSRKFNIQRQFSFSIAESVSDVA